MKTQILILMMLVLTACGQGGTSAPSAKSAPIDDGSGSKDSDGNNPIVPAPVAPPPIVGPTINTVDLVYYSHTITDAPVNGWVTKTYTAKGSCVVYLGVTYCWDDGVRTIPSWRSGGFTYPNFNYTYWQINMSEGPCAGGCADDLFSEPLMITANVQSKLANYFQYSGRSVQEVFTSGTPKTVTCTLSQSETELDCVDFVIDLAQSPL